MKKLRKLILPISLVSMLALGSTSIFANNTQNTYSNELNMIILGKILMENYTVNLVKNYKFYIMVLN